MILADSSLHPTEFPARNKNEQSALSVKNEQTRACQTGCANFCIVVNQRSRLATTGLLKRVVQKNLIGNMIRFEESETERETERETDRQTGVR